MLASLRANRFLAPVLVAGAGALLIPGLAWAGSGGAGTGPGAAGTGAASPSVQPGNVTESATSNGITISADASAFVRSGVSVSGTVPAGDAGDSVEIDQLPSSTGATWAPVAVVQATSNGSFTAAWRTRSPGQVTIRAVLQGNQASTATAASPPSLSVTVYRRSIATLYGPGFYGHRTACGVILRRRTIGVANRTLPCGTEVQVYYRGNVLTVPVIDRGPYAHGANWDLTMASGRALGMEGTEVIGAASIPPATSPSSTPGATPSAAAPTAQ